MSFQNTISEDGLFFPYAAVSTSTWCLPLAISSMSARLIRTKWYYYIYIAS